MDQTEPGQACSVLPVSYRRIRPPQSVDRLDRPAYRLLLRRAACLPPHDQNLVRLALEQRHSLRQIAQIVGLSPGQASRRLRQLLHRLRQPLVAALIDFPADLPESYRRIGLARHVLRWPLRRLAQQFNLGLSEVRAVLAYLEGWSRITQRVWSKAVLLHDVEPS